ncbi:MAG: 4Fe-4S dicluster domain-containing protein [Candidatus Thermoplasmatota archaeon]
MDRIILKTKIQEFINTLLKDYEIYAPVKENNIAKFSIINDGTKIFYEYSNSTIPPKQIIFPQSEVLFKFQLTRKITELQVPVTEGKEKIILWLRPCDAKSFLILDKIFDSEYKDNNYINKRKTTTLVGLSCNSPSSNCFCTSIKGSPFSKENLDVLFTELDKSYYVEVITKKGEELIEKAPRLFSEVSKEASIKKVELQAEAERKIVRSVEVNKITEKLKAIYESAFWDSIGEKCIACGICAYLCPTCHCFDINDEVSITRAKGARIRTWDYCTHQLYTLQASGFNPRPTQKYRVRNRVYHKFKYFQDNFNSTGCVGCGRCVEYCPVNIDVSEILSKISLM